MLLDPALDLATSAVRAAYPALQTRVVETYRSAERQAELYARGRNGDPRPVVTYLDGVTRWSLHQLADGAGALAADVAILDGDAYAPGDHPAWELLGETAERAGAVWGGRWRSRDLGHLEVSEDTRVRALQRALGLAGESPGPVDGIFGPHTLAALTAWCAREGMPAPRVPRRGSWWWAVTPGVWGRLHPEAW